MTNSVFSIFLFFFLSTYYFFLQGTSQTEKLSKVRSKYSTNSAIQVRLVKVVPEVKKKKKVDVSPEISCVSLLGNLFPLTSSSFNCSQISKFTQVWQRARRRGPDQRHSNSTAWKARLHRGFVCSSWRPWSCRRETDHCVVRSRAITLEPAWHASTTPLPKRVAKPAWQGVSGKSCFTSNDDTPVSLRPGRAVRGPTVSRPEALSMVTRTPMLSQLLVCLPTTWEQWDRA